MKILMVSSNFPYPPDRGGTEIRTFNLLKHLSSNHEVTLLSHQDRSVSQSQIDELHKYVSELILFPFEKGRSSGPTKIKEWLMLLVQILFFKKPPGVIRSQSEMMKAKVSELMKSDKYDVITCEHSVNEIYIDACFVDKSKVVINAHSSRLNQFKSLQSAKPGLVSKIRGNLYSSLILEKYEKNYINKAAIVVATTSEDRQHFLDLNQNLKVEVVPNGVDLSLFPFRTQDPGGHSLVFIGSMDASHNIDAACYFATEIFPKLKAKRPEVVFNIVGSRPVPKVKDLENIEGVNVTGRVESVVDFLHQSTICVLPLRAGYGIKNKTLEAFATGVPVVGSDRALEGISINSSSDSLCALKANSPEEFIDSIERLLKDSDLREKLSKNGRTLVEDGYTWRQAGLKYEQLLLSL